MLRRVDNLLGLTIAASNGDVGRLHDLYFDDQSWRVRYLVVDTGPWLFGRRVLISPQAAQFGADTEQPNDSLNAIQVALTQEQIENSPDIDLDQPVSRQHEVELHSYYGWLGYWQVDPLATPAGSPVGAVPPVPVAEELDEERAETVDAAPATDGAAAQDSHLRSAREVMGYNIHTTDGEIGHVDDLLLDEAAHQLRYLVVDTRNWLPGKKVLVAVDWVREVTWLESAVSVNITREQVENSPLYQARNPISREFEIELYNAYDLPGYWI